MMTSVALVCLAMNVYHESRDQPVAGQVAVAQVVMNRVADSRYPDNPCDVIKDGGEGRNRCQFSWYCDGKSDSPRDGRAWYQAQLVASAVMAGSGHVNLIGVTHYHAVTVQPYWAKHYRVRRVLQVQDHIFYTEDVI